MNNIFRGLIAGYGAHKLGGGCLSTILVFIVIWVLLGQCGCAIAPPPSEPTAVVMQLDHAPSYAYAPTTISPIADGMAVR
jgi:hypothetical protein